MTTRTVETHFQLAKAWQLKGNTEAAIAGFQHVLRLDPAHAQAHAELGGLMLRQGRAREALRWYEQALALGADAAAVRFRHAYVKELVAAGAGVARGAEAPNTMPAVPLRDNPRGKIDLRRQVRFSAHRGSWGYALDALAPLHNHRGILFDGFIERNFAWKHWLEGTRRPDVLWLMKSEGTFDELATSEERGVTPYTRPWVGFPHNPQAMPIWFHYQEAPQTIFGKTIWQDSLETCVGLFALSEYHGSWLRQQTGLPVSVLTLPAEIPPVVFDFKRFMVNRQKKIVQIGWWLRKLSAIYQLPIAGDNPLGYEKIRLVPHFFGNADQYLTQLMAREAGAHGARMDRSFSTNTREIQHLPDAEYDVLLSENIAFIDLYDASANNAVVECIARATPLLVNPLPAVVEYLGADYPMYFSSLAEAADKALDTALIFATHVYLTRCDTRRQLSGDHFRREFEASEVYRLI